MTLVRSLQVYQRIETRVATRLGVSDILQRNETRFRTGCRAHRLVRGSRCLPTLRHLRLRVEVFDSCWRWKIFEATGMIWSMLWIYNWKTFSFLLLFTNAFSFQLIFHRVIWLRRRCLNVGKQREPRTNWWARQPVRNLVSFLCKISDTPSRVATLVSILW